MHKITLFALVGFFVSCSQDSSDKVSEQPSSTSKVTSHPELEEKMLAIDAQEEELTVANSLTFNHNDGSFEEVYAFLDGKEKIVKIEEKFTNGKSGDNGVRFFYLENGKKFISKERFSDNSKAKGAFRERISYYDGNGKVLSTRERLAQFEEDLEKEEFKNTAKFDCSMKTAEEVLNNKGVFSTTFQGFVENGPLTYLLVGGPGESGYASALAIQFEDQTIAAMRKNEKKYINRPLAVQFERMMDEKNLEFQVLLSMKMLDE